MIFRAYFAMKYQRMQFKGQGGKKYVGLVIPALTVVGGFGHSYCRGQVHTGERYGK
jgi:hypothetical protein